MIRPNKKTVLVHSASARKLLFTYYIGTRESQVPITCRHTQATVLQI